MDFKGETPAEAAGKLIEFLQEFATEKGETFEVHRTGVAGSKVSIAAANFSAVISFNGKTLSRLKHKAKWESSFGSGHLQTAKSTTLLKLVIDEEGFYRWHRIPAKQRLLNRLTPASGAFWFPLVSEFISQVLSVEELPEGPTKVLSMR